MQALRREQEELNAAIAKCQENLPASGVPVTRQVSIYLLWREGEREGGRERQKEKAYSLTH